MPLLSADRAGVAGELDRGNWAGCADHARHDLELGVVGSRVGEPLCKPWVQDVMGNLATDLANALQGGLTWAGDLACHPKT
jgi:hypothetical protein